MKHTNPKAFARRFLAQANYRIPLPMNRLTQAHGITILKRKLEPSITGMLVINGSTGSLALNDRLDRIQQRFWLAHLFGHFVLHRESVHLFVDTAKMRRPSDADARRLREQEANEFALELLIPERLLRDRLESSSRSIYSSTNVQPLAAQFAVTESLFALRLSQLGLSSS